MRESHCRCRVVISHTICINSDDDEFFADTAMSYHVLHRHFVYVNTHVRSPCICLFQCVLLLFLCFDIYFCDRLRVVCCFIHSSSSIFFVFIRPFFVLSDLYIYFSLQRRFRHSHFVSLLLLLLVAFVFDSNPSIGSLIIITIIIINLK